MPKTRINCPNCRQPIIADIDSLFDVGRDPTAKQKLLSGAYNIARCQSCGYQGNIASPIVYHDPAKELLLTYFPPELGMRRDDQERTIGALINQVVNSLSQEQRKGYLLRPQAVLTMQGMSERILEGDGITREMVQAQQQRLSLIQRLADATPEAQVEILKQEDKMVDADFFALLSRLMEASVASNEEASVRMLTEVQKVVVEHTTFGQEVAAQNREVKAAVELLRAAGSGLTREKLLELVIEAPNDTRRSALASMARQGMDYTFFQLLSERIEQAAGEEKTRLGMVREQLLQVTREVDAQMEAHAAQVRGLIEQLVKTDKVEEAMAQVIQVVDDSFIQELNSQMEAAQKAGDQARLEKMNRIVAFLQQASAPPGLELLEDLMAAPDEAARRQVLEANRDQVTPELVDLLMNLVSQVEKGGDPQMQERLRQVQRQVTRFSMEMQMKS